jgi:hypothetical protein
LVERRGSLSFLYSPVDDDGAGNRLAHGPILIDRAVARPIEIGEGIAAELGFVAVLPDVHDEPLELVLAAAVFPDDIAVGDVGHGLGYGPAMAGDEAFHLGGAHVRMTATEPEILALRLAVFFNGFLLVLLK